LDISPVSCAVTVDFRHPEIGSRAGLLEVATIVTMPKASMHENHGVTLPKYEVRASRQTAPMKAIT
jgi:hypothetical protein